MARSSRTALFSYLFAVIAITAALIGTMELLPHWHQSSFSIFFAAVMVSAWYGGLGPGLLATVLATAATAYFFMPPGHSITHIAVGDVVRLSIFALVAVVISKLTEARRRAERATVEQQEWLLVVLRSIADAVIATDTNGYVKYINRVAQEITGWNEKEVIGKPLTDFFRVIDEKTREPIPNPVTRVIVTGHVVDSPESTLLVRKDGVETPITGNSAPIRNEQARLLGVVFVFRVRPEESWKQGVPQTVAT